MQKLIMFNSISLDGYFTDENGDMRWAYNPIKDDEWNAFVANNAQGGGALVFGRVTYELMANYWPTPTAMKNDPAIAEGMNRARKIVFSRTLNKTTWENSELVKDNIASYVRRMKGESGAGMAILGSGSIVAQLATEGLIDEYQIVMTPVILGKGRTLFEGIGKKLSFKQTQARAFKNGNVLLRYEPVTK